VNSMTATISSYRAGAARALRLGAILLWSAAGIHFIALPLLRRSVAAQLAPDAYAFVWPPFAFSFMLDGILLLPLGLTALYAAGGILRGERWAMVLGLSIALVVLVLPFVLVLVMGFRYFQAPAFLVATLVILAAGLAMTVPLLRLARNAAV
jgi:hypothetical protein